MLKFDLKNADVKGKRVLVRADLNVPIKDGVISNDKRIVEALGTVKLLSDKGARVVVTSHLGRPEGQVVDKYSLKPVAERMSALLGADVLWGGDCVGDEALKTAKLMKNGQVMLLENTRFHAEEEANDTDFAKKLAQFCEFFVDDAFGTSHRAHASNVGVTQFLPSCKGLLFEKEIEALDFRNAEKPFVLVAGGAKVSDKIGVLKVLCKKADYLCVGGAMANTFLVATGVDVKASKYEKEFVDVAREILIGAKQNGCKVLLPIDCVVTTNVTGGGVVRDIPVGEIEDGFAIADIGDETRAIFAGVIGFAKTVFWNGPMGVFEVAGFELGTKAVAEALANCDGRTVVGGGDVVDAVAKFGLEKDMTFVSTGGGASLEFIAKQGDGENE